MNLHRPDLERLSRQLRDDYESSPRGEKMTALHFFGIVHADELAQLDTRQLEEVASAAGSASFATELRKMMKLARLVEPKRADEQEQALSATFHRYARPTPPNYVFDREEANER